MFFEPPPAQPELAGRDWPDVQPWSNPPELELGAVVAVERILARSANVVIALPTIRPFRTGCLFTIEVVGRQGTLSPDEWWDLQMSGHPAHPLRSRGGDRLPDKLLRLGVRYSDGAKATTVERHGLARPPLADPPVGPVLSWIPAGLWPLPPADTIEFAVEWPFGGISLTIVELDGAAIVSAAERSTRCWPDSSEHDPP